MNEEKLKKLEKKNRDEHLSKIYEQVIILFGLSIIGGIIGYLFCKDNQYPIINGIILGIACPWGYIFVDKLSKTLNSLPAINDLYRLVCLITFGIYAILWFIIKLVLSAYAGMIVGPIIAIYYVVKIRRTWKDDYSEFAKTRYYIEYPDEKTNYSIKNNSNTSKADNSLLIPKYEDEKYYCEMCFKEITREEYETCECLCEECYMDIHTDEEGNFREDYYKY